jgi:hypothetical protein
MSSGFASWQDLAKQQNRTNVLQQQIDANSNSLHSVILVIKELCLLQQR